MKTTVKILAVFMVMAMLSIALVGCSKTVSGKYQADFFGVETTFEFKSSGKVTKTTVVPATFITDEVTDTVEGTYEILEDNDNPDKLVIAFEFEGERSTYSFSEGEIDGTKFIEIDGVRFTKIK